MEKVKVIHSYLTLYRPWNSPGQNTGVGSLSLLQGIFLTQGANPGLPQCRWILYQLSHQGSPTMERGLIIKEDPYCSGRLLLWRGKIYNRGTLIPWGLLHRGGAMTIQRTIIIKGTITIEGDHSVEGDYYRSSVQFSSVAQSCLTLCHPMNRSTPGLPVHYQLPEPTQTHVH